MKIQDTQGFTIENKIFVDYFNSKFDSDTVKIKLIEELSFVGDPLLTTMTTYNAKVLYLILSGAFYHYNTVGAAATIGYVNVNDETNNTYIGYSKPFPVWDTTGVVMKYINNPIELTNFYFSRVMLGAYNYCSLTGFKITLF